MKTVLITGSSKGIGKDTALLFAEKGYHVFLNGSKSFDALEETAAQIKKVHGDTCTILKGDIGNSEDVKRIFDQLYNKTNKLDLLINNAAISYNGLFHEMSKESWDNIISTNLSSLFYCSKEALPQMISHKSGKILNISSMWGTVGASCEVAYSATKAGVNGLTKALAKEVAPSNIQVNAIAFGMVDTSMNGHLNSDELSQIIDEIPSNRIASSSEAAKFIWQVSNLENYMTGQIIGFDGGFI